jgi:BON domain
MVKYSVPSVASDTPGVQDVIDAIDVDPVSPMDDMIRLRVARLVYGSRSLSKYAIDPCKPIRISVQNGNVTVYGSVDSEADRDIAGIRASSVAGFLRLPTNCKSRPPVLSETEPLATHRLHHAPPRLSGRTVFVSEIRCSIQRPSWISAREHSYLWKWSEVLRIRQSRYGHWQRRTTCSVNWFTV